MTRITLFFVLLFFSRKTLVTLNENVDDGDDGDDDDEEEEDEEEMEETDESDTEEQGSTIAMEEEEAYEMSSEEGNKRENETEDIEWRVKAVREVGYYLRAHKFGDFDRRFHLNETTAPRNLFKEFPDRPLRSLHWEVRKYCESSFSECLQYLHEKVTEAEFQRDKDTVILMQHHSWNLSNPKDVESLQEADKECQRLKLLDWIGAQPFEGPLERFQWRTSASYYMCWYAMLGELNLVTFGEPCDNFASCWDTEHNGRHGDPRADDSILYQCALYSFCPGKISYNFMQTHQSRQKNAVARIMIACGILRNEASFFNTAPTVEDPCCPLKYYGSLDECWHSEKNPCFAVAPPHEQQCSFNRSSNVNFVPIVLNQWNVSCFCKEPGFEWNSKFGICIDVDECERDDHECNLSTQACFNLPGRYECGCRWGYLYDIGSERCIANEFLLAIENVTREQPKAAEESTRPVSVVKYISGLLFHTNGQGSQLKTHFTLFLLLIHFFDNLL